MTNPQSERERLLGPRGNRPGAQVESMMAGSDLMYDEIYEKTEMMKIKAKGLSQIMDVDAEIINDVDGHLDQGSLMMTKGLTFVKDIANDETGLGILKIAFLVFICLSTLYFGGKITFKILRLFSRKPGTIPPATSKNTTN